MPKWTSTSRYRISAINMATVWRHISRASCDIP
jgi:hypothetical protein